MNRDKKFGRRKAGTYSRTAKPAAKRRANKATRKNGKPAKPQWPHGDRAYQQEFSYIG